MPPAQDRPPTGGGAARGRSAGREPASRRTVFLSAGESSGDLHGARLAKALVRRRPDLRLMGLGGSRMRAAGVELLADLDTLAVMGFVEVLKSLPRLWRLRRRVWRLLGAGEVDLVVPIDYPGFNLSLACRAHREGVPVLYYIAPQVWAWRESRARRLADCTDRICVILPFEEELLEGYGADVRFVGHPLLDEEAAAGATHGGSAGAAEAGAGEERRDAGRGNGGAGGDGPPVLGLFPGSRAQEVERMLPSFLAAAERLLRRFPELDVRVAKARDLPEELFGGGHRLQPPEVVTASATAALTKSGTVTLELALAGVPMVVAYRMNPVTHWVARRLVTVDHISLVNLVAGHGLVPELVQDEATPERLAELVAPMLEEDEPRRRRVREGLAGVRERLGEPGCAERVAGEALALLEVSG